MNNKRQCGECQVCCIVADVTEGEFKKPSCVACPLLKTDGFGCSVFGKKERPNMCSTFECSWLKGFGSKKDRPDKSGVMVSVNNMNGGNWIMVMDYKKNAHLYSGKNIVVDIASQIDLPAIVVDYDNLKKGKGDYVLIKGKLKSRSSQIMGDFLGKFSKSIDKYKLIIK
ncbi:hypothetical protein ACFL1M_03310 [Patescibacteria group bacterium]